MSKSVSKYKIVINTDDNIYTILYKAEFDIYNVIDWVKNQGYSIYDIEEIIKVH